MSNLKGNKKHTLPQYTIRLPKELRDKLVSAANSSSHSLNKEIIARLRQSLVIDQCPECIHYLKSIEERRNIFEEQYKLFEDQIVN